MYQKNKSAVLYFSILASLLLVWACKNKDVYTLYRSSPVDEGMRIHIATFDASDNGDGYNQGNCEIASNLMKNRPEVTVKYWCEKGYFNE